MFEQWGLPKAMRFDNGKPWAHPQSGVPTNLALWLVGLGIHLEFGRPRQSTDNAVVERSHGVLAAWVEPQHCADQTHLAQQVDKFVHIQRAVYPCCDGQSRFDSYPDIHTPYRTYDSYRDPMIWQQDEVLDYVAQFRFTRTVEKIGRISHFMREYSVGRDYAAQQVTVYLHVETIQWLVEDRYGEIIARFDADQFDYLTIANMNLKSRTR